MIAIITGDQRYGDHHDAGGHFVPGGRSLMLSASVLTAEKD